MGQRMAAGEGARVAPAATGPEPGWARAVHRAAWAVAVLAGAFVLAYGAWWLARGGEAAAEETDQVWQALLAGLVVCALAAAVVWRRPERGETRALVGTAAAWTLTLLAALAALWWLIDQSERQDDWAGTPVTTPAEVAAYLEANAPPAPGEAPPVRIPTGVMLQSVEFLNANNVQVSGYVWQVFDPTVPAALRVPIVLPEAVKEAYQATEAYRATIDGVETIGWYFSATLRQPFEYEAYPFDRQDVWIRLWHPSFTYDVQLVPDLASYHDTDPATLPGIEDQFVYGGWTPLYSGFSFAANTYDSSFGLGPAGDRDGWPELYFNVVLERGFLGPLTDHLIFAFAAALLLFGLLVLTTDNEDLKSRFGLSTAGVLAGVSGLFFAVIVKHNQIRGSLAAPGLSYIEAIPAILYVLLVLVALNAILLAAPLPAAALRYRHNLLPKLLYWPVLLGLLLAVTLAVF